MNLLENAPAPIRALVEGLPYEQNTVGMSGAGVLVFADRVLKIAPDDAPSRREAEMMAWLRGRLPVPLVLARCVREGRSWLLMSRLPGVMCCDLRYMARPDMLVRLLAQGLQALWQVNTAGCPARFGLEERLLLAEQWVREGKCDLENVEPDTYGPGGFRGPEHLLQWLKDHRPPADPVLSHGDFCLPNLFAADDRISGYLDLGFCAVADRYQDIALCYRSLLHNAGGGYGGPVYPNIRPEALFDALDIAPDWEKVRYYRLLDELF